MMMIYYDVLAHLATLCAKTLPIQPSYSEKVTLLTPETFKIYKLVTYGAFYLGD